MIVIEMTEDNEITRVYAIRPPFGFTKEIDDYRIEYVDRPAEDEGDRIGYVCKFCGKPVGNDYHLHQMGFVGDKCCWDERLRATE